MSCYVYNNTIAVHHCTAWRNKIGNWKCPSNVLPLSIYFDLVRMVLGVLERLHAGEVIVGDGSYVFTLEKRGYVGAGKFTPGGTVCSDSSSGPQRRHASTLTP